MVIKVVFPQECLVDRSPVTTVRHHRHARFYNHYNSLGPRRNILGSKNNQKRDSWTSMVRKSCTLRYLASSTKNVEEHFNLSNRENKNKGLMKNVKVNNNFYVSNTEKTYIDARINKNQRPTTISNLNHFHSPSIGNYVGSTFVLSPSPKSLPIPSFSIRMVDIDESATKYLRKLLGLD